MTEWIRAKILGKGTTERKNFIWNMAGSGVFAAVSMLLSFYVIRVMGEDIGGIFSIAITLSQMFAYIMYFEMRTYQVTDVERRFTFAQYHGTKVWLGVLMMLVCISYMFVRGYDLQKAGIILLMCIYRLIDGYADLYEGTFQQEGRLDLTGKSLFFRTIFSAGALVIAVQATHQMMLSVLIAVAAAVLGVYVFDIVVLREFYPVCFDFSKVWQVAADCFAMFAGSFLWTYILSASRIAIDANMASNYQSYYQTIFMPVSVINLFVTFILKPALTTLSNAYGKGEWKAFFGQVMRIAICIIGLTLLCMGGAYLLGIPVLSALVGCDLSMYRGVLVLLMAAGGFNSLSYFMYYLLSIMRKPKSILIGYGTAAALTFLISSPMVKEAGIFGAAMSFFVTVSYLSVVFLALIAVNIRRRSGKCPGTTRTS